MNNKTKSLWIVLIIASSFGPYVPGNSNVRMEHIFIYPFALFSFLTIGNNPFKYRMLKTLRPILLLFLTVTIWTIGVTILSIKNATFFKIIAGVDNYLLSIMAILAFNHIVAPLSFSDRKNILSVICKLICIMLCLNTMLSISSIYVDVWPFVQHFVRGDTGTGSPVWRNSFSNGRLLGIFNQPMEAGLCYSYGFLALCYLNFEKKVNYIVNSIFYLGVMLGGVITVSKVFILLGFPICVLYFLLNNIAKNSFNKKKIFSLFCLCLIFSSLIYLLMRHWSGGTYLGRLFDIEAINHVGVIEQCTSGRFGRDESLVKELFVKTIYENPLFGFGFGAFSPLDNGYLEFFYQGGSVALFLYLCLLVFLSFHAVYRNRLEYNEGRFLAFLMFIVILAGVGAPVFTINRSSIILMSLIVAIVSVTEVLPVKNSKHQYFIGLEGLF